MLSLVEIMPPRMRTRSAGRPIAKSRGGGTGEQLIEVGGIEDLREVGDQGNVGIQNGNVVNEKVQENVGNVVVNGNRKMESVQDMRGCSIDQKVKYTAGLFVGKALTWWNSQIRTLSREVVISMSWNDFKFMMVEEFCPSHEMQKLETELWNHAMVGVGHVVYTDRLTISPNVEVFFDLLNLDVLDGDRIHMNLLDGFRSCTSRSRYRSISKDNTDFHLHCEYLSITRMFWQDLKDNA
ncbi:reverse transcriptase domain-containing protein [Tanacetum coccineum]